ncbi:MAG: hypothetical protein AB8G05_02370 [Oligoflexales bacterium]
MKKVHSPSMYLRLGTSKNISDPKKKILGFNIAQKLADQLGYKIRSKEIIEENLADDLSNKKFDLILAPKSLAQKFPMLKEPQGFDNLQEELTKLKEAPANNSNDENLATFLINHASRNEKSTENTLTLYLNSESELLTSFEKLISHINSQYSPNQILRQW